MFLTLLRPLTPCPHNLTERERGWIDCDEKFILCNVRWRAEVSQSDLRSPDHLTTGRERERSVSLTSGKAEREV